MSDRARAIILTAVKAGRASGLLAPDVERAIEERQAGLRLDALGLDSLGWMEFCISVELESGLELALDDVGRMELISEIENWVRTRL
jgi:acyl carrier protein